MKQKIHSWVISANSAGELNETVSELVTEVKGKLVTISITEVTNKTAICPYLEYSIWAIFEEA